jgi:hypothetical protein
MIFNGDFGKGSERDGDSAGVPPANQSRRGRGSSTTGGGDKLYVEWGKSSTQTDICPRGESRLLLGQWPFVVNISPLGFLIFYCCISLQWSSNLYYTCRRDFLQNPSFESMRLSQIATSGKPI